MRPLAIGFVAAAFAGIVAANASAADHPISAHHLQMKSNAAGKGKLLFLSKDGGIVGPTAAGTDDPSVHGATLELCAEGDRMASFELPAAGWKANGPGTVWRFVARGNGAAAMRRGRRRGRHGGQGPTGMKVANMKGGRRIKLVGKSTGLVLDAPLVQVGLRLTMGDSRHCALFDTTTVTRDEPGRFKAQNAVADTLADCSDAALGCPVGSPSGAFLR